MYICDFSKAKATHDHAAVTAKFASVDTLRSHGRPRQTALGFELRDVIDVVQALEPGDLVKSEKAHNPPNSKIWHDTYYIPYDGLDLYLKFSGETLIDVTLTSFKEVSRD